MLRIHSFVAIALLVSAPAASFAAGQDQGRQGGFQMLLNSDANGDGVVTREEFLAARSAMFARIDLNHDGVLDRSDLDKIKRFRPQAADKAQALITELDLNHDGQVTSAELKNAPTPVFDRFDGNHDGRLDQGELAKVRGAAGQ